MDKYDTQFLKRMYKKRVITASGCWEWTGYTINTGYGQANYAGRRWSVHRLIIYILKPSEYKYDMLYLHKCNNRKCFNPDHLYSGTKADNSQDTVLSGNFKNQNTEKTICKRGHEFTLENTIIGKDGSRHCRICTNELNRISKIRTGRGPMFRKED